MKESEGAVWSVLNGADLGASVVRRGVEEQARA